MTGTLVQGGGLATAAGKDVVLCAELRILQRPICIDLFCGLGGWTEGFLAEGYTVIGFDNHRHEYGEQKYPGQLVIQDVLTLHGSQFKDAAVIVASPPCQNYSYLAMPWSRSTNPDNSKAAKALRLKWETEGPDNRLFDACFRIQREACEAAGRYIPLIVENVRGAIPWVGRSAWNYGSFHLWGDVPALMPISGKLFKKAGESFRTGWNNCVKNEDGTYSDMAPGQKQNPDGTDRPSGSWFRIADSSQGDRGKARRSDNKRNDSRDDAPGSPDCDAFAGCDPEGMREPGCVLSGVGLKGRNGGGWFGDASGNVNRKNDPRDVRKMPDGSWKTPDGTKIGVGEDYERNRRPHLTNPEEQGTKIGGDWFSDPKSTCRKHGSRSQARKAASAQIAKIPFTLSSHIAQVYKPKLSGASRAENGAAGERL